jgi:glycosyltransferase involved in cell wall biosynthesis
LRIVPQIRLLQAAGWPIRWLKHVDDRALHRAYRECSFTVYPSLQEGFGLPILESLWHGKPCVCGNNGALGEVAQGGGCFYVDQMNASSIADGMRRVLTERELYQRLCAEARARKFRSWSDYIDKLLEYMQRVKAETRDHKR